MSPKKLSVKFAKKTPRQERHLTSRPLTNAQMKELSELRALMQKNAKKKR